MTGTSSAVALREPSGALAIQDGQVTWDPMQLAALAQLGVKDAPDGDKQVFLHVSQRTGLDPFARQIYMIERKEKKRELIQGQWRDVHVTKWTIQTGIEGWRVIRDRAERRYGVRGIKGRFIYYAPDGSEHKAWLRREPPVACEMTYTVVEPGGREVPYTSVLRFSEYAQTKTVKVDGEDQVILVAQWASKPVHMLEKCTEADAYRAAFPQDYSGVVLDDAMPQAAPDWDAMSDEELDERARAVGYRSRVTAEQARARAPQQVKAEVITTDPAADAPPSADAEPEPDTSAPDPHDQVLGHLERLTVTGPDIGLYLTRIAGRDLATVESLNHAQAEWFNDRLAKLTTRDELEAAAVAAEAKREQATNGD